ncbi:MAG: Type 1 glutamine amidotransferase-like domain-containing protein [Streptosporangiaceae bacterium]
MAEATRQIFAYSGVLYPEPGGRDTFDLAEYALTLAGRSQGIRVCYLATAIGDLPVAIDAYAARFAQHPAGVGYSALRLFTQPNVPDVRAHLLAQDVILVEGGSVVNLMAVWRAHGLPPILRECWERGVVLAGTSAGSLCWHTGGPTDSYRDALDPFTDGLALVPYSNGVHDDLADQPRRETYRRMVADGILPAGYATEDGVGLHYVGTELHEAVSVLDGKRAWRVHPASAGTYAEAPVTPRLV